MSGHTDEGRRPVGKPGPPVDPQMSDAACTVGGKQFDRGVAEIAPSLLDVVLAPHYDKCAAISSKAASVGNSMVASCGSGQLDSFAATMFADRLT
jgi:hypothetical protein